MGTITKTITKKRTWEHGCIYSEHYNKGGGYKALRNVAEVRIGDNRYRFRSTSYGRCCQWMDNIDEVCRQVEKDGEWHDRQELASIIIFRLASIDILPIKKSGDSDEQQLRPATITVKEK